MEKDTFTGGITSSIPTGLMTYNLFNRLIHRSPQSQETLDSSHDKEHNFHVRDFWLCHK
jgi:hypothetical protein